MTREQEIAYQNMSVDQLKARVAEIKEITKRADETMRQHGADESSITAFHALNLQYLVDAQDFLIKKLSA